MEVLRLYHRVLRAIVLEEGDGATLLRECRHELESLYEDESTIEQLYGWLESHVADYPRVYGRIDESLIHQTEVEIKSELKKREVNPGRLCDLLLLIEKEGMKEDECAVNISRVYQKGLLKLFEVCPEKAMLKEERVGNLLFADTNQKRVIGVLGSVSFRERSDPLFVVLRLYLFEELRGLIEGGDDWLEVIKANENEFPEATVAWIVGELNLPEGM
jgi:hypothetical protein